MKWIKIAVIMIVAGVAGCMTAEYGKLKYSRLGDIKVDEVRIIDPNGVTIIVKKAESKGTAQGVGDVVNGMIEAFKLGAAQ